MILFPVLHHKVFKWTVNEIFSMFCMCFIKYVSYLLSFIACDFTSLWPLGCWLSKLINKNRNLPKLTELSLNFWKKFITSVKSLWYYLSSVGYSLNFLLYLRIFILPVAHRRTLRTYYASILIIALTICHYPSSNTTNPRDKENFLNGSHIVTSHSTLTLHHIWPFCQQLLGLSCIIAAP